MAKKTLIIEFQEDDTESLKEYALLNAIIFSHWDACETIRSALRSGDHDQRTITLLEKIRDDLYVEGLEDK